MPAYNAAIATIILCMAGAAILMSLLVFLVAALFALARERRAREAQEAVLDALQARYGSLLALRRALKTCAGLRVLAPIDLCRPEGAAPPPVTYMNIYEEQEAAYSRMMCRLRLSAAEPTPRAEEAAADYKWKTRAILEAAGLYNRRAELYDRRWGQFPSGAAAAVMARRHFPLLRFEQGD